VFAQVPSRKRTRIAWVTATIAIALTGSFLAWLLQAPDARWPVLTTWGVVPNGFLSAPLTVAHLSTLVTALFLHADWIHLVGNLAFLLIFGFAAERALGSRRFLALFFICGVLGNVAAVLFLRTTDDPVIGASGAISAIIGAYMTLFPGARLGLVLPLGVFLEFVRMPAITLIGLWVLVQIAFTVVGDHYGQVAWVVHLAGFIAGVLFALASRAAIQRRLRQNTR
jgi:membrane associated rhomboid family serine protease